MVVGLLLLDSVGGSPGVRGRGFVIKDSGTVAGCFYHILRTFSENCFVKNLTKICQKIVKSLTKICQIQGKPLGGKTLILCGFAGVCLTNFRQAPRQAPW